MIMIVMMMRTSPWIMISRTDSKQYIVKWMSHAGECQCAAWEFFCQHTLWSVDQLQQVCTYTKYVQCTYLVGVSKCCLPHSLALEYFVLTFPSPFLRWSGHIFQAFYNYWQIMSDFSKATFAYVYLESLVTAKIWTVSNLSHEIIGTDTPREYSTCGRSAPDANSRNFQTSPKNLIALNLWKIWICCK